ncbi:hypothetical protein G6F32_017395 [Rhizopus arrhizus]|nr:hypothetical protein G6F32_017395 [Rhizopus arrhizus]
MGAGAADHHGVHRHARGLEAGEGGQGCAGHAVSAGNPCARHPLSAGKRPRGRQERLPGHFGRPCAG